jgi:Fe2+ transport system protein FeoA
MSYTEKGVLFMRHRLSYRALMKFGFSAYKALEIVIDAGRGDPAALRICRTALVITRRDGRLFR